MKKILFFLLTVMIGLSCLSLSAQQSLTVAGGSETNNYVPLYGTYADDAQHNQVIYPASMLTELVGSAITTITFYVASTPAWGMISYNVSLGTTTTNDISGLLTDPVEEVFSGHVEFVNNMLTFVLDEGFVYSGDNLLLDITTVPTSSWQSAEFFGITTMNAASIYQYSYGGSPQYFLPKTTFVYDVPTGCQKPNELQISNITTSSATFSWHPRTAGTSYVAVDLFGADPADLTWTSVSDTFYTFTDLSAGSKYVAYVYTDCGTEYSTNSSISFYTDCDIINTFPYFEGFENEWISTVQFGQNSESPLCWTVYNGGGSTDNYGYTYDYRWKPNTNTNQVYEGNHSAVCYTDYAANPHNDWLISPLMAISDNMQVSFWAQRSYATTSEPDEISIWISEEDFTLIAPPVDSTGMDTIPLPGFTQIFQTDIPYGPFDLYEIPLTGYTGNRYIAFVRRYAPNDGYNLCLDNVTVAEIPVCQRPYDQTTDSIGTDFAYLSWTSDADNYILYYKLADADSFTVVTDVTLNADSQYVLYDLIPGYSYEWYVAAVCNDGTILPATTAVTFQTECVPVTTLPYSTDFETNNIGAGGDLPACWSKPGYNTYPYVYNSSSYSHSGSHCLYSSNTTPSTAVLPELGEDISINDLQLSFWAYCYYGSDCLIEVGAMTDPSDESTFTLIDSVTFNNGSYSEFIVDLSSYEGTAQYVALRLTSGEYNSGYGYYSDNIIIDDLSLMVPAGCPRPENVTVSSTTPTTATLTWTSEESAFLVYYKQGNSSTYTLANESPVNENTYTVEELTPGTDYAFYVSALCSDESEAPSLPAYVSLPCEGLTTLPYFCGFEENLVGEEYAELPQCWKRGPASTSYPYAYSYGSYQGTYSLYAYYSNTVCMPPVDTTELPFSDMMVSFYAKAYAGDVLKVGVMTDPNNMNSFVQVGDDIVLTTNYTLYEVSLADYQGSGNLVSFLTPQYSDFYMDNVTLDHLPDCQRPTITNVLFTNTEATVNWTANEDDNAWQIVITSTYADPATLTPEDVTENSYTFSDLTPGTLYQVYVRTDCGDQYSEWSNVYSFVTLNSMPATVPYACDFENEEEAANWTMVNSYLDNKWFVGTATNNTPDGQYSLYVSSDSGATVSYNTNGNTTVWAYRDFLFSNAAEFNLSFDWRCLGENGYSYYPYDYMEVYIGVPTAVSAGSSSTTPSSLMSLGTFAGDSTWNTTTITLDGTLYANSIQRVYFLWYNDYSGGSGYSAAVDNVAITEVECARPAALQMTSITTTTATLTITPASESDATWEISLNDSTFTVTDAVVEITGLTPATSYEIYVRTICDGGDTSVWSLPISFISECVLINTVPQTWGFESDLIGGSENYPLPVCWNRINSVESSYTEYPYVDNYAMAHSGFSALYYYAYYSNCYGILPPIDNEVLNIQDLQLSFYATQSGSGTNISLVVGVMTDPTDASTFTEIQTITVPDAYPSDPFIVSFADYTGEGTYIAIKNLINGYAYSSIYVDDITLENIPACPTPSNVSVTATDLTTATISWNENGEATSWNVMYSDGEDETTVVATTNPFTLTGLTSGTAYTVQVQSACGDGESSNWTGAVSFATTICAAADQCTYTFNLTDSYGDGWNGGYLDIQQNGISVGTVGLTSGSTGTETINLCDDISTSLIWIAGSYAEEPGFSLVAPDGTELCSYSSMSGYSTFTFTTACNGTPQPADPTVTTSAASNIAQTTATLNGSINNPDNVTITAMGFEWKATAGGTYTPVTVTGNNLTYDLTNLTANTGYTYKAFITFNGNTVYGDEVTFTTLEQGQAIEPSATTNPATNVTQTTATLNGTITNPDNVTITAQGFEWKAASAANYTVLNATGSTMSSTLNNLTANTNYTYRAFVTTANGTHYGSNVTFTTLEDTPEPCDVPTNLHTTDVQNEAISIAWDANANVNSWNVQYRPAAGGQWTQVTVNTNSYTITNLTGKTNYEIQVQANCGDGNLSDWSASITAQTTDVGIVNYLENSITLFPNPANDVVNVQCTMNNVQLEGIEVIDVYGKVVRTVVGANNYSPMPIRINVSGLANGMYFVRVTTDEGVATKTFIKK